MTVSMLAAVLCAAAAEIALPARFDADGYYHARRDMRRCMSPVCGGYWLTRVNHKAFACADGTVALECYVSDIKSEDDFNFIGTKQLLKGTLGSWKWNEYTLGVFKLETAYAQASTEEGTGLFVGVAESGLLCVTTPCPTKTQYTLNTDAIQMVDEVQFSSSLDEKFVALAQKMIATRQVVVLAGTPFKLDNGVTNLAVNQIYLPGYLACSVLSGYEWANGVCATPHGCVYPQLEMTIYPGLPDSPIRRSCVDKCTFPAMPAGPGRCIVALP